MVTQKGESMKFRIEPAAFGLMYDDGTGFVKKYRDKLAPYKLELIKSNEKYGSCKAYVTVSTLQELVELKKNLGFPIIIKSDDYTVEDEICILIYDDYIE